MVAKDVEFFGGFVIKRAEKKLDTVMAVDSGAVKGTGKTVFSCGFSKSVCQQIGYPYQLDKLMVLNATEGKLIDMVKTLPPVVPIHVDEAIFIAYKRDYNEDPVKKLVKFINICRKFKKPIILNTPSFWDLDKDIRNLCDFRATIVKRGIACIRGKYPNPEYEDLWLREESKETIDKEIGSDITDLQGVIRGIGKCRNHLFDIIFPDMDPQEYSAYEKLSMAEEGKQLYLDEKRVWIIARILTYLLLEQGGFTPTTLSREINQQIRNSVYAVEYSKFHLPLNTLVDWRKEWRRAVMVSPLINNKNITNEGENTQGPGEKEAVSLTEVS